VISLSLEDPRLRGFATINKVSYDSGKRLWTVSALGSPGPVFGGTWLVDDRTSKILPSGGMASTYDEQCVKH